MAKYVVNSHLSFARNFILAEKSRLRSSPLLQATKRCASFCRKAEKSVNEENTNNHFYNFNFLIWVL